MAKFIVKVQHDETIAPRVVGKDKDGWFTTGNSKKQHQFHSKEEAESAMKLWLPEKSGVTWEVEAVA